MPIENNFQHDELTRKNPGERLTVAELTSGALPESPAWFQAMGESGQRLSQAGVRALVLVHGSIPGTDVFGAQRLDEAGGLKRGYSRGVSGVDALLAAMREETNGIGPLPGGLAPPLVNDDATRQLLDEHLRDAGNFSQSYVALLQRAIGKDLADPLPVIRIVWASQHHHLGRALAAVNLLDELHTLSITRGIGDRQRILVLAHGQAGLVLALASNLLCPSPITGRPRFLHLLSGYAEQTAQPQLAAMLTKLEPILGSGGLLNGARLDVVTMGSPVRYGWDPSGLGKLMHIVNHRNLRTDGKTWLAKMELPQVTMEMPVAWGGDYVQQLAVAGTDALPGTETDKAVNKALWEFLEPYDGFERWLECARRAVRFPTDGHCMLADYKDCTGSTTVRDHYFGHAAYTRIDAMRCTISEITQTLYPN
jgi:hypothetical protein